MENRLYHHLLFESRPDKAQFVSFKEGKLATIAAPAQLAAVINPSILRLSEDELFICGGKLHAGNGSLEARDTFSDSAAIFNLKSGKLEDLPKMSFPREDFRLIKANNLVYAIGGQGAYKNRNEVFNLETKAWSKVAENKNDVFFIDAFFKDGKVTAVANNFIMETLGDNGFDLKEFPYHDIHYLFKPRLLTPISGSQILFSNRRKIFCLDVEKKTVQYLFSTKSKPVSIFADKATVHVLDNKYLEYTFNLEKGGEKKRTSLAKEGEAPAAATRRTFASARYSPELRGDAIQTGAFDLEKSLLILSTVPKPRMIEFRADGSRVSHALPLTEDRVFDCPVLGQYFYKGKILFYSQMRLGVYDPATGKSESHPLQSLRLYDCSNVSMSNGNLVFATIDDFQPTMTHIDILNSTPKMNSLDINHSSALTNLVCFDDFVLGFGENDSTFVNNLVINTWNPCFPVAMKKKKFYLTDLDGELLGIDETGSVTKAFLKDGIDNNDVEVKGKFEFNLDEILKKTSCSNLFKWGNIKLFAVPLIGAAPEKEKPVRFFLFKGLSAHGFADQAQLAAAFEKIETKISPRELSLFAYLIGKSDKGVMRSIYAFD